VLGRGCRQVLHQVLKEAIDVVHGPSHFQAVAQRS
jgi:hypothetical protein